MRINILWIFAALVTTGFAYSMQNDIKTLTTREGKVRYKCLLCNFRSVSRIQSLVGHWLLNHPTIANATIEKWKNNFCQCPQCLTYHSNASALALHYHRKHRFQNNPYINPHVEQLAPYILLNLYHDFPLSNQDDKLLSLMAAYDAKREAK